MAGPERILIIGPNWVGDMVMTEPVIALLNAGEFPSRVDILAPPSLGDIVARMPEAGQFIPLPFNPHRLNAGGRIALAQQLARQYDRAIIIPISFISALVPWLAGVPERIGYIRELRYGLINRAVREITPGSRRRTFSSYHHIAGVKPGRKPVLLPDQENGPVLLRRFDLTERRFIALFPGAEGGEAKKWPISHFAMLARHALSTGYAVAIFGGANDRATTAAVAAAAPGAVDLGGQTRLGEAIDIISAAAGAIGNDTGLMHVAAAVGTPIVGLYGPTAIDENPPLTEAAEALTLGLSCSPCRHRTCPLHHHKCLVDLPPALAITALERLLYRTRGEPE